MKTIKNDPIRWLIPTYESGFKDGYAQAKRDLINELNKTNMMFCCYDSMNELAYGQHRGLRMAIKIADELHRSKE